MKNEQNITWEEEEKRWRKMMHTKVKLTILLARANLDTPLQFHEISERRMDGHVPSRKLPP